MPQTKNSAGNDPETADVLGSTEILRGIGNSTLKAIAAAAMQKMVEEGETLYSVGDPVRSVYVVAAGRLRFILGGDALLGDQPRRIATVMALEECRLLEIEGEALLGILDRDPRSGYLVMQRLARMITQSFLEQSTLLKGAT